MKSTVKKWLKRLPIPLSKNHRYDILTRRIIRRYCRKDSNCIDVGTHEGEILDLFLKAAPQGHHYGFEAIPEMAEALQKKYEGRPCEIVSCAITGFVGTTSFNHVTTNPAYSGVLRRKYDTRKEEDEMLLLRSETLDHMIPQDRKIRMIKIDVEGGEHDVMKGAKELFGRDKPIIIFECGLGGTDVYRVTPQMIFEQLSQYGYGIYLLEKFLGRKAPLTLEAFVDEFNTNRNYYFVAAQPQENKRR